MSNRPIDDASKPSRINRRRKRKWKMTALALTAMVFETILTPLSVGQLTRFDTRQKKTVRPIALNHLVSRFFYAFKKGTESIRAYTSSMVGYFSGAASVFAACQPWILSHRPRFDTLAGGYFIFKTGNHMNTTSPGHQSAQQNPQTKTVSLFDCFLHRRQIAYHIPGTKAEKIKRHHPAVIVKFAGFQVSLNNPTNCYLNSNCDLNHNFDFSFGGAA